MRGVANTDVAGVRVKTAGVWVLDVLVAMSDHICQEAPQRNENVCLLHAHPLSSNPISPWII